MGRKYRDFRFIRTPEKIAMDITVASVLVSTLGGLGVLAREYRLRRRDREDYLLRRHIFDNTLNPGVLDNLPETRAAEQAHRAVPQLRRSTSKETGGAAPP